MLHSIQQAVLPRLFSFQPRSSIKLSTKHFSFPIPFNTRYSLLWTVKNFSTGLKSQVVIKVVDTVSTFKFLMGSTECDKTRTRCENFREFVVSIAI